MIVQRTDPACAQANSAKQQRRALTALEAGQAALRSQQEAAAADLRAFKQHASGLLTTLQTQARMRSDPACRTPCNQPFVQILARVHVALGQVSHTIPLCLLFTTRRARLHSQSRQLHVIL